MPGGDGTGPGGMGPMTGRGAGYCAGYAVPGYANPVGGRGFFGRGFGAGFGGRGGRGFRNRFYATGMTGWQRAGAYPAFGAGAAYAAPYAAPQMTAAQELDMLKAQAENLSSALEGISQRIGELEQADK